MAKELEDYECEGCRGNISCGECPNNEQRKREYHDKNNSSTYSTNIGGIGFISD